MPALSVLLPVRDARPWLGAALASLWRQTLRDFEVVAIDDGSTDGSGELLDRLARGEPRLRVLHTAPCGLPQALNTGLALVRAPLVARQDADDLSHRRRFELQVAHLRRHPRDAVVGSRVRLFPAPRVGAGMRRWVEWHNALLTHDEMAREMLIDSALTHGTAVMRTRWLERVDGWTTGDWPEDLDLWLRLLDRGARLAKLPQPLYAWRQHPGSATRRDPRYHRERFVALKRAALERGLLRDADACTLIGVGESLARWHDALGSRRGLRVVEARRPRSDLLRDHPTPWVLVFVARTARERWRTMLVRAGLEEGTGFIFVA